MAYKLKKNLANKKNYGGSRKTSAIKYIVIHYTANDGDTDEGNGKYFRNNIVKASAHYFVDSDSVTQSVPDDYVAWSVGGSKYSNCKSTGGGKFYGKCTNSNSISIELCDDKKNGTVYPSAATITNAIELTKGLMKKYGIPAENVIRHFDVTGKSCPAYWCGTDAKNKKWKTEFQDKLSGGTSGKGSPNAGTGSGSKALKASDLKNMGVTDIIKKVGPLFTADQKRTGILASVSLAQFILESDYGRSELAQAANNCFGMKKSLSGNTWADSAWDGKSVYRKPTKEHVNGKYITVTAEFRKYPDMAKSIADHSAYLLGAINGSGKKRYAGIKGETSYKKAITIIKNGGYATSPDYIDKICNLIEKYNLTLYDVSSGGISAGSASSSGNSAGKEPASDTAGYYRKYTGKSIHINDVFRAVGVPEKFRGSYMKRKPVAVKNGIANYKGAESQNLKLIALAKKGRLKKA